MSAQCGTNKTGCRSRQPSQSWRAPNRNGCGKVGKRKAAFQLSHSHDYYELHSVMGYGFKGQVHHYYKTKGLFKKELVDETPFEEPCRKELEKWGRFTLVPDIKGADLVIRAYEKGQSNYVPVMTPGVTGSVNVGQSFFILDVWQPSSKKVIWSASKNVGTSWSTHTGIANLVKRLREDIEEQDKSAPILDGVSKAGSANPQN